MSMLNRYKKPGGFVQLLKLIETFGPQKREKFMGLIESESPAWSDALKTRLLSLERIFSWDQLIISEVIARLPEKTVAFAMYGLSSENKDKVLSHLTHADRRRLEVHLNENTPSEGEIAASMVKIIEQTRELMMTGLLRAENIDKEMVIDEKIEDILESGVHVRPLASSVEAEPEVSQNKRVTIVAPTGATGPDQAEVDALKRKVVQLQNEIKLLKQENLMYKTKFDQIKKLA